MSATDTRVALGEAAVVSVRTACEWLPLARDDARRWLREQGLVSVIAGREVVVWRAVLARLEQQAATPVSRIPLRRASLD